MEPTTAEIARDLRQLEARVERERAELLEEVRRGFVDLRSAIEAQSSERITRDVYRADQRRQESEIASLRRDVAAMRRVFVGGFLAVIAASVLVQMMVG
jgi:ATP-dependent helicase YprA (DUF1998 family)